MVEWLALGGFTGSWLILGVCECFIFMGLLEVLFYDIDGVGATPCGSMGGCVEVSG